MGGSSSFRNTKGQVTIFIILAIVIVVLGVLIYAFLPQLRSTVGLETKDPYSFIQSCMEEKIEDTIVTLSFQGGSINPEGTFLYGGNEIEYLCYTNEDYKLCSVQQPFIKKHVEEEIRDEIRDDANECFRNLERDFQNKGYDTILTDGTTTVEILPKRILTTFNHELNLRKESTENYDRFNIILNNNLYEMLGVVSSIVEWEATLGDADCLTYMMLYPDLKCEKPVKDNDATLYVLTDTNTGKVFQFASRSKISPPGY